MCTRVLFLLFIIVNWVLTTEMKASTLNHSPKTIGAVGVVPVSYTHLDVYKRQPQYCG